MAQAEIIGIGRSGIAAARLLKRRGWEVTLGDSASKSQILARSNARELMLAKQELEAEGIIVKLERSLDLDQESPNLIVVSPGVPWDIPLLAAARSKGIATIGELELAWRYLKQVPWLGITGTNGKTTTTALVAAMFKAAGLDAPACGNIGYAACELALKDCAPDWVIAEISSYQIESSQDLQPQIGIWTTFTADHLARHKTIEKYCAIKTSLLRRSHQPIINRNDAYLASLNLAEWPTAYWTNTVEDPAISRERLVTIRDGWVVAFGELILPVSLFRMSGKHNQQNLLLAVAAARLAKIPKDAIAQAITTFGGVPHRLEPVGIYQGIEFINDSKATNYDAAEVGLNSVAQPTILIAGGAAKAGDDTAWINKIKQKAVMVLLIGEAAPQFARRFQESDYENYEIVETLDNAVTRSLDLAQSKNAPVVLLSPACASFDQYLSFEHRGDHFRELYQALFKD